MKNLLVKVFILLSIFVLMGADQASAISQNTLDCINNNTWCYYDPNAQCSSATGESESVAAGTLPSFIPEPYNGLITQGATDHNVAPSLLAALFSTEHNLGNSEVDPNTNNLPAAWANLSKTHPDPNSNWAGSSAGANGPFQFIKSTWEGFSDQPYTKVNDFHYAAEAAGNYAEKNHATVDASRQVLHDFIFNYNHSETYVKVVFKYYDYYNSQPGATPDPGAASPVSTTSSTDSACSCQSAPTQAAKGDGSKTIVLDPGHAPAPSSPDVDSASNIVVSDYANNPEMKQMYDAAQSISTKLKADGYTVLITKTSLNDYVDLKERAEIANQANAALGVSLHSSPGDSGQNNVFYPKVGEYRYTSDGHKAPAFSDQSLSDTDKTAAKKMADARESAEGDPVKFGSYGDIFGMRTIKDSPPNMQKGNVLTTQYFAKVPWVYNEQAQDAGGGAVSDSMMKKYEKGVIKGIEAIVPLSGDAATQDDGTGSPTNACTNNSGVTNGDVVKTALGLAWPEPFDKKPGDSSEDNRDNPNTPTSAYKTALKKYNSAGFGVTAGLGNDCGIFVATVMHASGADASYPNSGTIIQANYVLQHDEKYDVIYPATTAELKAGDILILNENTTKDSNGKVKVTGGGGAAGGHTMIYVGKQKGGYDQASASYQERSANLTNTQLADNRGQYMIARLK